MCCLRRSTVTVWQTVETKTLPLSESKEVEREGRTTGSAESEIKSIKLVRESKDYDKYPITFDQSLSLVNRKLSDLIGKILH